MKTRILASALILPFLVLMWLGGWWFMGIVLICTVIGVREFYKGAENAGIKPSYRIGYCSVALLYVLAAIVKIFAGEEQSSYMGIALVFWLAATLIASMIYGFDIEKRQLSDSVTTFFGAAYVALLFYHLVLLESSEYSIYIWYAVLTAFGTDTMAYFTGYFLGKHKLCPVLSPKKTVEGAAGGVAGSVIFSLAFYFIFIRGGASDLGIAAIIILAVLGSVAAQLGDLSASAFKRRMGIKDYGNLIPGHGGILDRFDSVLFTGTFTYYFIAVLCPMISG